MTTNNINPIPGHLIVFTKSVARKHIDKLVSTRLHEAAPINTLNEYIERVASHPLECIDFDGTYYYFFKAFAEENGIGSMEEHRYSDVWRDTNRFYDYFKDIIQPLIDELVEYRLLQRFRRTISEEETNALLLRWAEEVFDRIEDLRDTVFFSDKENYQARLNLLLIDADKKEFLYEMHKFHFSTLEDNADDTMIHYSEWGLNRWRYFTPQHLFGTLLDTLEYHRPKETEKQHEFDFQIGNKSNFLEMLIDRFGTNAADYLTTEWIKKAFSGESASSSDNRPDQPPVYQSLPEIFKNPNEIEPCVNALRSIKSPVINAMNDWTRGGGGKSVLVAWIEVLELRGKIYSVERTTLCSLLANYFPGLKISDSIFRKPTETVKDYTTDFLILIK